MAIVSASELVALVLGAGLAGGGRVLSDWRSQRRARIAYLSSIKTEIGALCDLIRSQMLHKTLNYIIGECEAGRVPERVISFDFGYNYFSCFDSLGSEIRNLREDECRAVVEFYIYAKAAFDTLKVNGPLARQTDPAVLAQNCRFLLSVMEQLFALNNQIQKFVGPRLWWGQS